MHLLEQSLYLQQWKTRVSTYSNGRPESAPTAMETRVSTFYNGRPESPPATVEVQNIQENVPKNQLILGVKMVGRL